MSTTGLSVGLMGLAIVGVIAHEITYYSMSDTVETRIVSTEIKRASRNSDKYLVFAEGEVFQNVDSLFLAKFNSSDIQSQLTVAAQEKKVCTLQVVGYRYPFLSTYRNITSVDSCK